jgi:microcompartment protein CcmL/EutN
MTDEMKLHRQRTAGLKAAKEWGSPVLQEIIAEMEEDVSKGWMTTKADEGERREELYYFSRAVEDMKHRFQKRIADGKYAEKQIEEIEDQRKK